MQPSDLQPSASPAPTLWQRIRNWDSQLTTAKGLTIVTMLAGFLGYYFQYLNAYEDKVRDQAKVDMTEATTTFIDISNAFAETQTLQELVYFNFLGALNPSDAGEKDMVTKAGRSAFTDYAKARTSLREKSSIFARKAEIYIDWASDLGRDPAEKHELNADPLTETLLGNYNFNCDARANFPHYKAVQPGNSGQQSCVAGGENNENVSGSSTHLCAHDDRGKIIPGKEPLTIDWHSAKHHVVTMHYCFGIAHRDMDAARVWAAGADISDQLRSKNSEKSEKIQSNLNSQVVRLNAFMSLVMSQLERIRVKYRPSGFYCHLPVLRDAIGLFSERCTPVRTATGRNT